MLGIGDMIKKVAKLADEMFLLKSKHKLNSRKANNKLVVMIILAKV